LPRILFAPAAWLVGRLRYAQKFVVVGLVLLVPLGFVAAAFIAVERQVVNFSTREQRGVEYMAPLVTLTARLVEARHRNLAEPNLAQLDLQEPLEAVDRVNARYGDRLDANDDWRVTRALIETASSADGTPRVRFDRFNGAVDALLAFIVHIGDESSLTHDPDLDTDYLMDLLQFRLPAILDTAGRAVDRVVVASAEADDSVFIDLGLYGGELVSTSRVVEHAVQAVAASTKDDHVRDLIVANYADYDGALAALTAALTDAVRLHQLTDFGGAAGENLRSAVTIFTEDSVSNLQRLLATRIARYTRVAERVAVTSGVTALLGVYLFVGFYLSVARPIRRIVATLNAVSQGDLDQRVTVGTHDELAIVARALNESIAQTKVVTDRLEIQATYDPLTALPNRELALDRMRQALSRAQRTGGLLAVFFIDLDRFKLVNDSLGHEAGDEVLCEVSARLRAMVRASDTVARLSGDEFVAVFEDLDSVPAAIDLGERVIREVSRPIRTRSGREVGVGASVGVCFTRTAHARDGAGELTPEAILRDADLAMYRAKQRGRGRVEIFDDDLRASVEHRAQIEDELRTGIAAGELCVYYQPVVDFSAGRLAGLEALVRWRHPRRGLLSPAQFLDVAEDSGLIVPLGEVVLNEACAQLAQWRRRPGYEHLRLAVNVSGGQIEHGALTATVEAVLARTGLDPDALWLDLTERTILNDVDEVRKTLLDVHRLGVHLAIDDFGTGHSSLTHLRRFPVEALKVDRQFVAGLGQDPESDAIVAMILGLARTLGLHGVAEGVENERQFERLRELGGTDAQGYLFGAPVPADEALTSVKMFVQA
jgi:diguanylate cyclase (GGDEF)-like protein